MALACSLRVSLVPQRISLSYVTLFSSSPFWPGGYGFLSVLRLVYESFSVCPCRDAALGGPRRTLWCRINVRPIKARILLIVGSGSWSIGMRETDFGRCRSSWFSPCEDFSDNDEEIVKWKEKYYIIVNYFQRYLW